MVAASFIPEKNWSEALEERSRSESTPTKLLRKLFQAWSKKFKKKQWAEKLLARQLAN